MRPQRPPSDQPTTRRWRQRERPEPTVVWQTLGITLATCALGVAGVTIALPKAAPVRPSELWIVVVCLIACTVICLLAHVDVNKGRRSKEIEVEELPP